MALVVKKLPANIEDIRDKVLIPGSGRSHARGHENPFQYTCLGNPRAEDPGGLQFVRSQRAGHNRVTKHAHNREFKFTLFKGLL